MKFGVNSRTNIPYSVYHRGRKAIGECLLKRIPSHDIIVAM